MINQKNTIKNIVGLITSAGLTMATTSGSNVILGLLNTVAGGILGNYVNDLNYNKLKELVQGIDPSDLNHDIKKIILLAIEDTIKLICNTYNKKYFLAEYQKSRLDNFEQKLLSELKGLKDKIYNKEDSIYLQIENPESVDELFDLFNISIKNFPEVNSKYPFGIYFKEQFIPILQLCFGEQLKSEKNRPALIAYQREIYQTIDNKLEKTISQNELILSKLDSQSNSKSIKEYNNSLVKIQYEVSSKKESTDLLPEFKKVIDNYYLNISEDISLILEEVQDIKKGINDNWVSKNKVYILSFGAILVASIFFLLYFINNQPYDVIIKLEKDPLLNINSEFPKLGEYGTSFLNINLPSGKISKPIPSSKEIIVNDLNIDSKFETVKIMLDDLYWQVAYDSITLSEKNITIIIKPNDVLAEIYGEVFDKKDGFPIENATLRLENTGKLKIVETKSNKKGFFRIKVPINQRRLVYKIEIIKDGYKTFIKTCNSASRTHIPLSVN